MPQGEISFSIVSMAQLAALESHSCIVKAINVETQEVALLYFKNGAILNAKFGDLEGKEAALAIFSHADQIKVINTYQLDGAPVEHRITEPIEYLILEASRLADERKSRRQHNPKDKEVNVMKKLQETQDYLKNEIEGFVASAVVDVAEGLPLAGAAADPNFDVSIPSGFYTDTFRSAVKGFESVGWGMPKEVLMPGESYDVLLISLKGGKYYQGIVYASKTPLGMVRAIYNKIKPDIEKILP